MHIWHKRAFFDYGVLRALTPLRLSGLAVVLACVGGCAAPGPPLPPTLNLPQVVAVGTLSATRVGDAVRLRWTMPTHTTDKLMVRGPMTAEVCRDVVSGGGSVTVTGAAGCVAVLRVPVVAGASAEVEDRLPPPLIQAPTQLLAYRVLLLNEAGRTAGPSLPVYEAAGPGPAAIADFAGQTTAAGVELRWQTGMPREAGMVELQRALLDPPPVAKGERRPGLPGAERQAVNVRLRADIPAAAATDAPATDTGGMLDRTVELGHSYRYTAQRVVVAAIAGHAVELRSVPSEPLTFVVRDVFPPPVPDGLVAVPGFAGHVSTSTSTSDAQRPVIDLSWDPVSDQNLKTRLAGYKVYRRNAGGGEESWRVLTPSPTNSAAYRDADVVAGRTYAYRITAVSTAGIESAPGSEAQETAAQAP